MNHQESRSNSSSPSREAVTASFGALEVLAATASSAITNNVVTSSATSRDSDIIQRPHSNSIEDVVKNESQFDESRAKSGKHLKKKVSAKTRGEEAMKIETDVSKTELRKGKWSSEEEDYAASVIHYFSSGLITLPRGETLRSFLAGKLHCDPMRITKKYAGAACLGKRIHRLFESPQFSPQEIKMAKMEIDRLEERFRMRLALGDEATLPPLQPAPIIHGNTTRIGAAMLRLKNQVPTSNNGVSHQNPFGGNSFSATQPSLNSWNANPSFMNVTSTSCQQPQIASTSTDAAVTLLGSLAGNPQLAESIAKNPSFPLIVGALNQSTAPVPPPNLPQTQPNSSVQQTLRQIIAPSLAVNIQQQMQPAPQHQVNQLSSLLAVAMQQALSPSNSNIPALAQQPAEALQSIFSSNNYGNPAHTEAVQKDPQSQKLDQASIKTLQQVLQSQLVPTVPASSDSTPLLQVGPFLNSTVSPSLLNSFQNLAAPRVSTQSSTLTNNQQLKSIRDVFQMLSAYGQTQAPLAHAQNHQDIRTVPAKPTSGVSPPSDNTLNSNLAQVVNQNLLQPSFLLAQAQTGDHWNESSQQQHALMQAIISTLVKENRNGMNASNKESQKAQTNALGLTFIDQEKKIRTNSSTHSDSLRKNSNPSTSTTSTMSTFADESKRAMLNSVGTRQLNNTSVNVDSSGEKQLPLSGTDVRIKPPKKRPKFINGEQK